MRGVRCFKHYNKEEFIKDIAAIPWSILESFDDINDALGIWNDLFVDGSNRHAPLKKILMISSSKPWISNDLRKLMAERDYAKKVAKKSGTKEQWDNYRSLKNLKNKKLKSAEALHYKNLIESATDLKERWRSLNSVVGSKQDFGSPLQVQDGKRLLLEPKEVATKVDRFFATIGTKIAGHLPPVDTDAWKKYELERKCDDREPWDFQQVVDCKGDSAFLENK